MMESIALKLFPIILSTAAFFFSLFAFSFTRREARKAAERQFLEHSSTIGHLVLLDLEKFINHPAPEPLSIFTGDLFKQLVTLKQAVLRFQTTPWYQDFDSML